MINRRKNGELYYESMSITPIVDTNGNLVNYLAIKEDITDRKHVEEEWVARESAEKAYQAKSIFLSNMSHEIRTPLNAIIGFAQVLDMDVSLSPDQRGYVRTINTSSRHLLDLINDILDLSKIEANKLVFAPSEFDFKGLLAY